MLKGAPIVLSQSIAAAQGWLSAQDAAFVDADEPASDDVLQLPEDDAVIFWEASVDYDKGRLLTLSSVEYDKKKILG